MLYWHLQKIYPQIILGGAKSLYNGTATANILSWIDCNHESHVRKFFTHIRTYGIPKG